MQIWFSCPKPGRSLNYTLGMNAHTQKNRTVNRRNFSMFSSPIKLGSEFIVVVLFGKLHRRNSPSFCFHMKEKWKCRARSNIRKFFLNGTKIYTNLRRVNTKKYSLLLLAERRSKEKKKKIQIIRMGYRQKAFPSFEFYCKFSEMQI